MADFISREKTIETIRYRVCQGHGNKEHICKRGSCAYCGIMEIMEDISSIEAADVQSVDRWISVDVALPIYDGLVLICYNDKRIRLGVYTEDGWDSDEGNPIMEQPDFWMRIPEPPKQ